MVSATSLRSFTSIGEVWRRRGADGEHRCICQKLFGKQLFWFCPQKTFPFTATSLNVPLFVRATPGRHAVQQCGRARVRGRTGAITRERPDSRPFPATDAPTVVNPDENLTLRSAPPARAWCHRRVPTRPSPASPDRISPYLTARPPHTQTFLGALDTSLTRTWREEERQWRGEDREWRSQDMEFRVEERDWWHLEHLWRQENRKWRREDIEQRVLENARWVWLRHAEKNRRDVEEKSEQLKSISNLSALIGGFAVVAFVELQFSDPNETPERNEGLIVAYAATTALVVALMLNSMVLCSFMLCSILRNGKTYVSEEEEADYLFRCRRFALEFKKGDSPPRPHRSFERHWETRCEDDWRHAFRMFTCGVPVFLINVSCMSWLKFHYSPPRRGPSPRSPRSPPRGGRTRRTTGGFTSQSRRAAGAVLTSRASARRRTRRRVCRSTGTCRPGRNKGGVPGSIPVRIECSTDVRTPRTFARKTSPRRLWTWLWRMGGLTSRLTRRRRRL